MLFRSLRNRTRGTPVCGDALSDGAGSYARRDLSPAPQQPGLFTPVLRVLARMRARIRRASRRVNNDFRRLIITAVIIGSRIRIPANSVERPVAASDRRFAQQPTEVRHAGHFFRDCIRCTPCAGLQAPSSHQKSTVRYGPDEASLMAAFCRSIDR